MPIPWTALATLGSGIFGALFGGGGEQEIPLEQRQLMTSQRRAIDTENALQQLLLARRQAQDPLWRAVQQMAMSRLPIFAKQGIPFDMSQPVQPQQPIDAQPRTRRGTESGGRAVPRF